MEVIDAALQSLIYAKSNTSIVSHPVTQIGNLTIILLEQRHGLLDVVVVPKVIPCLFHPRHALYVLYCKLRY